ncbi:E3 ubiquitin protein ligase SIRP1-like protein, partial [Tanacetum coccineum]
MCYPFYQIIELASDALAVICHQLLMHGTGVNIDIQTSNDFRQRVVLCALDMAENPLYSGHTVRPINILVECVASRPAILAVPDEPVEEEDDDYEDEEEEQQQEGDQEELEGEHEEQGGEQEEQGGEQEEDDDENDNQQEVPAEALVTALVVDGVTCSVCHDELEAGSMASRLPCFHFFHEPCIRRKDKIFVLLMLGEKRRSKKRALQSDLVKKEGVLMSIASFLMDTYGIKMKMKGGDWSP